MFTGMQYEFMSKHEISFIFHYVFYVLTQIWPLLKESVENDFRRVLPQIWKSYATNLCSFSLCWTPCLC